MSKLIIYRASAGSGKTYRLATEYLTQVIREPESYKRILAVTFTNKATSEMKGRILEELFVLSQGKQSDMGNDISCFLGISSVVLQQRAKKSLSLILHDYTLFSVSTIDSFVQRVIQALLWELGEQGGAEIQLDPDPVLAHAADNLLDSASQFDELMHWLTQMGENLMDEGGSWDVRRKLVSLGRQIFSESFRLMDADDIEKYTDKKNIEKLKGLLLILVKDTVENISKQASDALQSMERAGIDPNMFKGKLKGILGFFIKCQNLDITSSTLPDIATKTVQDSLLDSSGTDWVTKEISKDIVQFPPIQYIVQNELHRRLSIIVQIINSKNAAFISAKLILNNLENLALIGDLWLKVRELSKQEGFLLLSDSGHLLREFVKDTDAPFVYEKIGNRYDSFMIDEFQDTSVVQWHNFKPLIENSLSQNSFSMLVGDVKQSIYRWRNGDWRILASGVEKDLIHFGVEERLLSINWRSLPGIVHFNNIFFKHAIESIASQIDLKSSSIGIELTELLVNQVRNAYKDIEQTPKPGLPDNTGYVEVLVLEQVNNDDYYQKLTAHIPGLLASLRERHNLGEIAILVRNKVDGQRIANMILDYNRTVSSPSEQISFVSQEGLFLKSSSIVRLVIAAFRLVQNPDDQVSQRVLAKELASVRFDTSKNWHSFFTENYLRNEIIWLANLSTHSLQESFEAIVNRYNMPSTQGELAYLAELHEVVLNQSVRGGSDVSRFLEWWDENDENLSLSVPESSNSLSIITIHKSKGLEFPVVIIPYAGWPFRTSGKPPLLWVSNSEAPFNLLPRYPIYSTRVAEESLFALEVLEEGLQELVDNLNLLYVAFTRSQEELYIFVPQSKSTKSTNETKSVSDLMIDVIPKAFESFHGVYSGNSSKEEGIYRFGDILNLTKKEQTEKPGEEGWILKNYSIGNVAFDSSIVQYKPRVLNVKQESLSFYQTMPTTGSSIEHGKVMHQLFSLIINVSNVDEAIHHIVLEGLAAKSESKNLSSRTKALMEQEPYKNWFSGEWDVKTEASILTPLGFTYRPDRVMIKDNRTVVVDFKFGVESNKHLAQVQHYAKLLVEMGYLGIEGFIWYVDVNKLVVVDI